MVKPYTSTTQCLLSISDHHLPFPFNPISKININSCLRNSILLRLSQSRPTQTHQPIVCARRRGWSQPSNRKMIQLASMVAFNLNILPEPLNSLIGEIARGDWKVYQVLNRLVRGWSGGIARRRRRRRRMMKSVWFVFMLICVAGLWSWRISEMDLFLRALLFCVAGVSLIRLWRGKKAIKEWFLGFFFGIVLMMSSRLGKEDVKFWVQKLKTCSPVAQIAVTNRNRKGRISK